MSVEKKEIKAIDRSYEILSWHFADRLTHVVCINGKFYCNVLHKEKNIDNLPFGRIICQIKKK